MVEREMTPDEELKKLQKRHDALANEVRAILVEIDCPDAMELSERVQRVLKRKEKILSLVWTGKEE